MGRERSTAVRTRVGDVAQLLDRLAPCCLAQSWDNVGLLAGDADTPCRSLLLCVDLAPAVVQEAKTSSCGLIVAYHPPIFRPISRVLPARAEGGTAIWEAVAAGIAVYSPHTALDAAPGGTNDVLAELAGVIVEGPFEFVDRGKQECKVVVFVPAGEVERVAEAMFDAGAGRIGDYMKCSYRVAGQGTFFGTETTDPTIGQKGRLEYVDEIRLESVVPADCVPAVVDAIRRSHSYEEPAFDIYPLRPEPARGVGRIGRLKRPTTLGALARMLKRRLKLPAVELVGDESQAVKRAAVCVGSPGRLPLERPACADCDVVITGELRHHDALAFGAPGVSAVLLGHWASERPGMEALGARLREHLPGVKVHLSGADRPPTCFV